MTKKGPTHYVRDAVARNLAPEEIARGMRVALPNATFEQNTEAIRLLISLTRPSAMARSVASKESSDAAASSPVVANPVEDAAYEAWLLRLASPSALPVEIGEVVKHDNPALTVVQMAQVLKHGDPYSVFPDLAANVMAATLVSQRLGGAGAGAIAQALHAVYPALVALDAGKLLQARDVLPSVTADQMTAALLAAPYPAADVTSAVATLFPTPQPGQPAAMTWNFANTTSTGAVSRAAGQSPASWLTGVASQTGGGPAESFGAEGIVLLTRFLGSQYPFINVTTTAPVTLDSLSFRHFHNHNRGYPSYPSYQVQLQLDSGSGFVDIGAPITASPATNATTATVALGGRSLPSGTFRLRWVPRNLAYGTDTNTEYFAMNPVTLNVLASSPSPAVGLNIASGQATIQSRPQYSLGTGDFSITAVIRTRRPGTLVSSKSTEGGSAAAAGWLFVLRGDGTFKIATDSGFTFSEVVSQPTSALDGQVHSVAAVRQGGQLTLWFDGKALAVTPNGSQGPLNVSNARRILIGNCDQAQEPFRQYVGIIKYVSLWNRGISGNDLTAAAKGQLTAQMPGLVGFWALEAKYDDTSSIGNPASPEGALTFAPI